MPGPPQEPEPRTVRAQQPRSRAPAQGCRRRRGPPWRGGAGQSASEAFREGRPSGRGRKSSRPLAWPAVNGRPHAGKGRISRSTQPFGCSSAGALHQTSPGLAARPGPPEVPDTSLRPRCRTPRYRLRCQTPRYRLRCPPEVPDTSLRPRCRTPRYRLRRQRPRYRPRCQTPRYRPKRQKPRYRPKCQTPRYVTPRYVRGAGHLVTDASPPALGLRPGGIPCRTPRAPRPETGAGRCRSGWRRSG